MLLASSLPRYRNWRFSDRGRTLETSFCYRVFTEQPRASRIRPPTCSTLHIDPENHFFGHLRSRGGEVRFETDLLPVHSCASTAAKSTRTTRSDCSYDPLVSAHRSFEPAEGDLRKLLCIVVGKREHGAIGRLHGLENMTMVCMYINSAVLLSTRLTGRVLSTASGRSCSSAPQ